MQTGMRNAALMKCACACVCVLASIKIKIISCRAKPVASMRNEFCYVKVCFAVILQHCWRLNIAIFRALGIRLLSDKWLA